ncbi:MAG: TerB family tellurite resistance protein [Sediminicola sp.]|tara:strand:+ start:3274 stop:3675 length:402 start_codon:yes stop_codon:yes gene_type:complete
MSSYEEKLGILSEMIAFARTENGIKTAEYNFLLSVADGLGVDRETFHGLLKHKVDRPVLSTVADRILQFHRLVLLMNVDGINTEVEISRLYNVGLGMGLPPSAIEQVLVVMHRYPYKIVPPEVLISIFKAHYN